MPEQALGETQSGHMEIIARIERLEERMTRIENNVVGLREDISVHFAQILKGTEGRIIKTMRDEIVHKIEALLEFKGNVSKG